jgi:site-specific recombinase XerD
MSVTLRKRKNEDGSTSLLLDIYHKGVRRYEFLKHLKLSPGTAPDIRQRNKENLNLAKQIQATRAKELSANDYSIQTDETKNTLVLLWMQAYVDKYKKKDKRNMVAVFKRFKAFITQISKSHLLMKDFSENIVVQFRDALSESCQGEGAKSYYARFKKMVKQAAREKMLQENPCQFVEPPKGEASERDVLTFDELQILSSTYTKATEVKRAFLFSSVTGLAWVDVKGLTWENVNLKERKMKIVRSKLKKYNRQKEYPLNDTALKLLGEPGKKNELIFDLPTANGANRSLNLWVQRAGIEKHITWHCGRHGFGTNLIFHGTDILTTKNLLGHETMKYTQRYVRASEEMNRKAVDNLPNIKL